ncbi:FAD-dependent oxidoreductase [Chelativorans sp. ZYF759]|uniref:NAD(P)/FAD-dependent oxidoreductase n=1 Tax=Chelativorans sp. ZYF759 TaxID=2692213 RepID=UPI00145D9426|nr:FAD-dependent oxidoreductase [Chelativorans sp. ZYF759]NMG40792.1 FAD-dependent oxidoreductase [Chelativorans sp. ZYF759]
MNSWPADRPSPLWRSLSRERFSSAPLSGNHRADVVVVGGGIAGLTTALELNARGRSVVVLEAASVGAGASGRANGQVIAALTRYGPDAIRQTLGKPFLELLSSAADRLFGLVDRYGINCDAQRTGWLQPAHTPRRAARVKAMAAQWVACGAPARALDREEMAARIGSDAYCGGWEHRGGGHINPYAFTVGLARAAAGEGVVIHENCPVTALTFKDGLWRADAMGGTVSAPRVVLATAAHTGDLWPGLRRTIVPVTSYQAATVPLGAMAAAILPGDEAFSDTRQDLRYMRKDREGRIVSGGALALQVAASTRLPRLISGRLGQFRPELAALPIEHVWGGRIAMTVDRLPHLHRTENGLATWIGCNGRGLALACAMAQVLADAVCDVPDAELALRPTPLATVPLHPFVSRTARMILPWLRWQDSREV